MRTRRSLFFIGIIFLCFQAYGQTEYLSQKLDSFRADPWVDSVYNTMSLTDRINQLFILELGLGDENIIDSAMIFGGIILRTEEPHAYSNRIKTIQNQLLIKPLIFHQLKDPLGLKLDSVDNFNSVELLDYINEPYLFYETGVALANQCKTLGISALYDVQFDILRYLKTESWQFKELSQGLFDNQIIPINAVKIHEYKNDSIEFLDQLSAWDMIAISPGEVQMLHKTIMEAISLGVVEISDLESKCKDVLAYKKWLQLDRDTVDSDIETYGLLNNPLCLLIKEEMAKYFLVVSGQEKIHVPIRQLENKKVAHLSIGNHSKTVFNEYANKYTQADYLETGYQSSDEEYADLWTKLNSYDIIIATYYNLDRIAESDAKFEGFRIFQEWMQNSEKTIPVSFLNDSGPGNSEILNKALAGVIVLEDNLLTNKLVPQLIFGGIEAHGKLKISKGKVAIGSIGRDVNSINRFSYTVPEAVGISSQKLEKIDSIAIEAIQAEAIPGCQILVAKDNHVVFQKSFGFHTYDSLKKVSNQDLYDLASVTKVSGALPCLMKLYEEGKFDIDATMGTYLPYFKRGNKKGLTYREILAHQSGLTPYIVYWKTAIKKNGKYKRKTLSDEQSDNYTYELSQGLYLHKDYKKKIYKQIRKSKLGDKKYSYSGLTFLLYPEIIEKITGQKYEDYLYENFYKPLGASSLTYSPLEKFNIESIVPTEYDSLFRKGQIHGKVHDEAAAMMGGISCNAGLFSNANDLAKLFQMYCNYGTYGDKEYINEETLMEFSRCQYPENDNRRGLGFDRPLPEPHANGNTAKSVSQLSFGHSGFTGTFAWVDPEYNLVYIFLSNRVYPTRANTKLYNMNVRTNIQEAIYEAMASDE